MKKITLLGALLIGAIGIGQNFSQETVQPISGQNGSQRTAATTQVAHSLSEVGPNSVRLYNGISYHNNPASEEMMPVLAYSTGPYFNVAGNPDISLLENTTLGMGTLGGGMQVSAGNRMAEDIILADDYDITSMDFYGYQTGTPTSPPSINEINVQIWDGDPSLPSSTVIYGDAVTNVLTSVIWSNAYRESETTPGTNRAIHRVTVETPNLSLTAGTYWVDWQMGGTSTSGPWQPPVVILGQSTTGNAMQFTGTWGPFEDSGTFTALGAPLDVYGDCTSCGGGGATTTFTTLMDFENACIGSGSLTMEDFQGALIAPNSVQGCGPLISSAGDGSCYNPGEIQEGVEITSSGVGASNTTVTIGEGAFGINPNDVTAGADFFAEYTIVDFTGVDPVTSAGFEIYNFFGGNDTQVRLFDTNGALVESFTIPLGQGFFAFISDQPISRMEIEADANDGEYMANLFYGACLTNDECSGAIEMACGDSESGDTNNYSDTGGFNASPDAWYSFTGSGATELVTFSLCNPAAAYDSVLTVYDSCGGTQIANNDDSCGLQSELTFLSDGTTTYYVAVEGFGTAAGAFTLTVSCAPVADNDLCADAATIACGETVAGSTLLATPDTGAPDCGGGNDSPGVWYQIDDTSGLVTDYTVSLCDGGTAYDSKLVIYSGDDCGTLVCVAENDDSCGLQSEVSFQGDGSSTYYILVNGFGSGNAGDFSLNLECVPVPPFNDMIVNSIDVDELGFPYTDPAVPMPAATTEAGGTPAECDNAGVLGVWYNFVPEMGGTANARVISPAGYTSVTFYTAPNEEAVETDLTLVDWFDNQCVPGVDASIPVVAGQAYYVYVANHEGITDIEIDGDFYLGVGDAVVDGFTYFPNPANNELNLDAGTRSIDSATIYNILGQSVVDQAVGATSTRLDVANLSVGTYIMKVVVEGEVGIYKIVKQ